MSPVNNGYPDAVILCGGLGTRLQSVIQDRPKPLADFNDRPFLDLLIDYVAGFGYHRFILCAGYKGERIESHYQKKEDAHTYVVSRESAPLGTAGAIKLAKPHIRSGLFLALNGDSFCRVDLRALLEFHVSKQALATIAVAAAEPDQEYGGVTLGDGAAILSFDEKSPAAASGHINAGIYIFDKAVLDHIPSGKACSLETQIFPSLVRNRFYGFVTEAPLLDIGTPERLERARKILLSSN